MKSIELAALRGISVDRQSKLSLHVRQMADRSDGARAEVTGRNVYVKYDEDGVLHIQREVPPDDEGWEDLPPKTPTADRLRGFGECAILLTAVHPKIESIRITGEDMRVGFDNLRIGSLAASRTITHREERGGGKGDLRVLTLSDCSVDDFRAHLVGGTLKINHVSFTEAGLAVGHFAGYEIRGAAGAGMEIREIPSDNCGEDCVAVKL
jgi:hypothetical protein